jgi:hypothetical protein
VTQQPDRLAASANRLDHRGRHSGSVWNRTLAPWLTSRQHAVATAACWRGGPDQNPSKTGKDGPPLHPTIRNPTKARPVGLSRQEPLVPRPRLAARVANRVRLGSALHRSVQKETAPIVSADIGAKIMIIRGLCSRISYHDADRRPVKPDASAAQKNPTRGHQAGQEVGSSSQYGTAGVVSVRSCAFVISAPMLICASCVLSEAGALPANHEIEIKLNATNIRESANRFIGPPP